MIAAFLCGLFYGALLLDAVKREGANRRLDGMLADLREYWHKDEGCGCGECCGCGEEAVVPEHSMAPPVWVPITTADYDGCSIWVPMASTGCEDG